MRYLAIDPGAKRTGLAVGDDVVRIASPLEVIVTASETERLNRIAKAIDEQGPDGLVVGLPVNMDDSEGDAARKARAFAALLRERFQLPVDLMDERLTSDMADEQMSQSGLTHGQKKNRRDALAAAAVLQRFLDRTK